MKHKEEEAEILQKVAYMENQISEVKSMYQKRMYEIEAPFSASDPIMESTPLLEDSSVSSAATAGQYSYSIESNMYPSLPPYSSTTLLHKNDGNRNINAKTYSNVDSTETLPL